MNFSFKMRSEENEAPFETGFGYEGVPSNEVGKAISMMITLVGTLADIIDGVGIERVDELFQWARRGNESHQETFYRLSEHTMMKSLGDTINCFLAGEQPPPLPDLRPEAD
jgi:hypothetical protein